MSLPLSGSVGQGGANTPSDVRAIQQRLSELGFSWVTADGAIGPITIRTIRLFQAIKNGDQRVNVPRNDGKVDVGGDTHKWLEAANAPRWRWMPAGAPEQGFVNIEVADPSDDHDYGTDWLAAFITAAGEHYRDNYRVTNPAAAVITVNDASKPQGGDTPDHAGHETGLSCDLRLPRTDGTAPAGTTYLTANYDQNAARAMLNAFRAQPLFDLAYFNDPTLIAEGLCAQQAGHDNHVHVQMKPPVRA